jgi:hypothetical protein
MTEEQHKQRGQQDQSHSTQRDQRNPSGSTGTTDKSKTNPLPNSGIDPKNPQDISKKDPPPQQGSFDRPGQEELDQDNKRRAF